MSRKNVSSLTAVFRDKEHTLYYVFLSSLIFFIPGICWCLILLQNPGLSQDIRQTLSEAAKPLVEAIINAPAWQLTLGIFLNNAVKSLVAMVFGIAFGVIPILFLAINGSVVGILGAFAIEDGEILFFLMGVLPHGVIEIPAVFLATALGMKLGVKAFQARYTQEINLRKELHASLLLFGKYVVPLLAIAAFIEVYLTPYIISLENTFISWFT